MRPPEQVELARQLRAREEVIDCPEQGAGNHPAPKRHLVGGCWALREAVWSLPHIGQSLQLLALLIGDDAVHHHPLGTIQDFGVHGESDAIIQQGATCKAMRKLAKSSSSSDTLHQILPSCKE